MTLRVNNSSPSLISAGNSTMSALKRETNGRPPSKPAKASSNQQLIFFGLTNSLATFQTIMNDIFQEEVTQGWLHIYMNDALIATTNNEEEHSHRVHQFLDKLAKHDLFLKPEKCTFHKKKVKYLGVIIGNGNIKMDPVKVEGIAKWPVPTTIKDVRSFLGFCNFYRAFIPSFSYITRPLNDYLQSKHCWLLLPPDAPLQRDNHAVCHRCRTEPLACLPVQ